MVMLRIAEALVALLLIAWTILFPAATLLSLLLILPFIALFGTRAVPVLVRRDRRRR